MAKKDRKRKAEDPDDDRPWDEDKWEAFMQESDVRSAKYGELLETLMDDPDRDRKIAREMGWDWLEEALDEEEAARARGELPEEEEFDAPEPPEESAEEEDEAEGAQGAGRRERDPFDDEDGCGQIPAYRLAFDVGMKIHDALQPYMAKEVNDKDDDYDRRLGEAYIGVHIAAAKISGGHAMGYEDDVLCGNIANCKRGLAGAEQAERAFLELKEDGLLPAGLVDSLLPDVRAVIEAVKERIEELRSRVWW